MRSNVVNTEGEDVPAPCRFELPLELALVIGLTACGGFNLYPDEASIHDANDVRRAEFGLRPSTMTASGSAA